MTGTEGGIDPKEKWWSKISTYLQTQRTRSKGFVLMISMATFVGGFVINKGFDAAWSRLIPSDVDAKIETISTNTVNINNAVGTMSEELKALSSSLPAEVMASLESKLAEIASSVAEIAPAAASLGAAKGEYVAGAKVSEGPYLGTGAIFLRTAGGTRSDSVMICDGQTVAFDIDNRDAAWIRLNGEVSRYLRFPNSRALIVKTVSATFNSSFEDDGTLRVLYNCDTK